MSEQQKIWFITGVSRGLGQALAQAVLEAGDVVIGTTRSGRSDLSGSSDRLHLLPLEVTDAAQVRQTVAEAQALYDRIDVVVNNAGYGLLGAIEEATEDEVERVFDVNFFGPLEVVRTALPILRAQRGGHVLNVSSIAALAPTAGSGLYAAAKSALGGMSQALAQEVGPLGIKVTLIEPGGFRTDFLSDHSIRTSDRSIEAYSQTAHANVDHLGEIAGKQIGDPARGARAIMRAVEADEPPMHLVLGSDALRRTRQNQDRLAADLDAWESVSLSTDFDG